jgi:hypothetical protein
MLSLCNFTGNRDALAFRAANRVPFRFSHFYGMPFIPQSAITSESAVMRELPVCRYFGVCE